MKGGEEDIKNFTLRVGDFSASLLRFSEGPLIPGVKSRPPDHAETQAPLKIPCTQHFL